MTSDVTIKQKAHQNNPIALFIRDIIVKNKNKFGIKLPVIIDFVDQQDMVYNIIKNDGKYYITLGKGKTLNATNPLKTKTKADDYYFEYNLLAEIIVMLETKYPNDGVKYNYAIEYLNKLLNEKIHGDITVVKHDKRFKINANELDYIVSRLKYFKNKMNIKKPIILEILDIGELRDGKSSMASVIHNGPSIMFLLDYNTYNENRGNIIGNKGFDMFLLHELTHTKVPYKHQAHGKEFKKTYKKYASDITKNKDLLNFWSAAHVGTKYLPTKDTNTRKHAMNIPLYSKLNIYLNLDNGFATFNINKGELYMRRGIKEQNDKNKTHFIYINVPENEKIKFMKNLSEYISQKYVTDDEYDFMVDYYIYRLYEKYGDKKYLPKLKSIPRYQTVMRGYKKVMQTIEAKHKKYRGKQSNRQTSPKVRPLKIRL